MNDDGAERLVVAARVRPLLSSEKAVGRKSAWAVDRGARTIRRVQGQGRRSASEGSRQRRGSTQSQPDAANPSFSFDCCCPPEVTTEQFYSEVCRKAVLCACEGQPTTIFAYGQTASGKTFTTLGDQESPGLIALAMTDVFNYIGRNPQSQFLLKVSCMQIYNEQIQDILNPEQTHFSLIEDQDSGSVHVRGLSLRTVRSPEDFVNILLSFDGARRVAETSSNEQSSRSHTLFRVVISQRSADGRSPPRSTSLNVVDLAGSERISMTSSAEQQNECKHINKSLSCLTRVIMALSERSKLVGAVALDHFHIPYRESKLTHVLKGALDGNSNTIVICTINPDAECVEESERTLRFGFMASHVRSTRTGARTSTHNQSSPAANSVINSLRRQLQETKHMLSELKLSNKELSNRTKEVSKQYDAERRQRSMLQHKINSLQRQMGTLRKERKAITEKESVLAIEEEKLILAERQIEIMAELIRNQEKDIDVHFAQENELAKELELESRRHAQTQDKLHRLEEEKTQLIRTVREGSSFALAVTMWLFSAEANSTYLKCGRDGKCHDVHLWIDFDAKVLNWKAKHVNAKAKSMYLRGIKYLSKGQTTHTFKAALASGHLSISLSPLSFSLVSDERSLDLVCCSKEQLYYTVKCLTIALPKLPIQGCLSELEKEMTSQVRAGSEDED